MKSLFRRTAAVAMLCLGLIAPAWAQLVIPSGGSFDVPAGSFDMGCLPVEVEGALNIVAGQFSTSSNLNVAGSGVFNGGSGLLTVGGNLSSTGTFNPETGTVEVTDGCTGNVTQLSGTLVFNNLTLSSTTGRNFVIPASANITVLGTLTLQGAPGQNIRLTSPEGGTAVINLGPNAVVTRNYASVAGNVRIGAAASPASIPTLNEYGLLLLSLLMGMAAFWHHRRGANAQQRRI